MTKAGLVERIKDKAGLNTKVQAEMVLDTIVESARDALLEGDSAIFTGFGSFKVVQRAARTGRNPGTGEMIRIPECKVVKYTMGKRVKGAIC
ncbi:HU family DNA-binding protein [Desulfovibrio ferrophilus]|uniref:DNA-binding protein HU n=1 Tax=Desulfovibrio ferrophilus TaxID=241368 RepID=A0A2Z6AY55_9BACT|nr:HU family DNA-binding protein [Desulfovibrio ferrophilus]BBD08133.1 DNA-binding protein HU [Desulfovibrio ferrophilus]